MNKVECECGAKVVDLERHRLGRYHKSMMTASTKDIPKTSVVCECGTIIQCYGGARVVRDKTHEYAILYEHRKTRLHRVKMEYLSKKKTA